MPSDLLPLAITPFLETPPADGLALSTGRLEAVAHAQAPRTPPRDGEPAEDVL